MIIGVGFDDLDHVRVGVAAVAVTNLGHLANQVLVVLTGNHRVELGLVALAVFAMAFHTLLFVQVFACGNLLGSICAFVFAVVHRDAKAFNVSCHMRQLLRIGQLFGKRVHGRVVARTGPNVGHLFDQHCGVLPGQLRESAVWSACS